MTNKTISINPTLFSIGGLKTKKNRDKKVKSNVVPLISPNVLKKKLLNRIREHKNKEIKTKSETNITNNKEKEKEKEDHFSDEFNDSINYLQTLTKQKKINEEKEKYEIQKQKRKQELDRKTLRHYSSNSGGGVQPIVNIDLPEELNETIFKVNTEQFTPNIQIKPYSIDNVPYGILKGGQKTTYRNWSKGQNNLNSNNNLTIQGGQPDKQKSERENRLSVLREKLKNKQIEQAIKLEEQTKITNSHVIPNLIQTGNLNTPSVNSSVMLPINTENTSNIVNIGGTNSHEKIIGIKKIIKKTIKKKYTLGKSKIKKMVGVLIKDRGTRKQVLTAQKELKRKSINEVKSYLRDHNLLKAGSNAPNDVVRKLYESAMLSGDITNSNTEILLHNFSKDDKEL
jgi:hypothetical protein